MQRTETRTVQVGNLKLGGGNPVVIQSMCNTDTRDVAAHSCIQYLSKSEK